MVETTEHKIKILSQRLPDPEALSLADASFRDAYSELLLEGIDFQSAADTDTPIPELVDRSCKIVDARGRMEDILEELRCGDESIVNDSAFKEASFALSKATVIASDALTLVLEKDLQRLDQKNSLRQQL